MTHAIDRLLSFCWWKSILKILGLLICGLNLGSRPSMQLAGILPSDLPAFFYIISILLFSETMYSQLSMVEMLSYLMMIPARTAFKLVKWFFTFHFLWVVQLNVINLISFFLNQRWAWPAKHWMTVAFWKWQNGWRRVQRYRRENWKCWHLIR